MRDGPEWRTKIRCTLDDVETFCQQFRAWHATACGARDAFISELLLREVLGNCVQHCATPDGWMECVLRGGPNRLLIAVRDEGKGFDWKTFRAKALSDNLGTSGRGLAIYRQYAHRVRFIELGNGVTLVRFFTTGLEATEGETGK